MKKLKIPCKILDTRRKDGRFFGIKYFVTVKILTRDENKDSPITDTSNKVMEIRTGNDSYYLMEIGKIYLITFAKDEENGKWSVYRPD